MVREHAVLEGQRLVLGEALEPGDPSGQELNAEGHVSDQASLCTQLDVSTELELACLADVVEDRRGEQQVRVEPRMKDAGLLGERGHRHGVLQQTAEIGVMPRAAARRAPQLSAE